MLPHQLDSISSATPVQCNSRSAMTIIVHNRKALCRAIWKLRLWHIHYTSHIILSRSVYAGNASCCCLHPGVKICSYVDSQTCHRHVYA